MNHSDIYTYFTRPTTGKSELLYSAEEWVRIWLSLETAGPVAVSTRQEIVPVLSGKGILLDDQPREFLLPRGDRLYIAAESINRVKFQIEAIPYLEAILRQMDAGFGGIKGVFAAALRRRGKPKAPEKDKGAPCPPPLQIPRGGW